MRKTGPILLLLVGPTYVQQAGKQGKAGKGRAGRQAGKQENEIRVGLKIFKILYRLHYLGFCFA